MNNVAKQLKWEYYKQKHGTDTWYAEYYHDTGSVLCDCYTIYYDNYSNELDDENWQYGLNTKWGNRGSFDTLEEAQDAAQRHFNQYVKSLLG